MQNDKAMAQLTYLGKKSVPSHIRPDLWNPFAIVTFPSSYQGLEAFRCLREFRLRHEYEWREHFEDKDNLPGKQKRMRLLQNQKPNTVADLAATLSLQQRLGNEDFQERLELFKLNERRYEKTQKKLKSIESRLEKLREGEDTTHRREKLLSRRKTLRSPVFHEIKMRHNAADRALASATEAADEQHLSVSKAEDQQSPREAFIQRRQLELLPFLLPGKPKIRYTTSPRKPVFTLNGVKIAWADANDRTYAESWPQEIEHEDIGLVNRDAPDPEVLRANVQWTQQAEELIARFETRTDELLARSIDEWNVEEIDEFVKFMTVRLQQEKHRRRQFYHLIRRGKRLDPEQQMVNLEVQAAIKATMAAQQIAKAVKGEPAPMIRQCFAHRLLAEAASARFLAHQMRKGLGQPQETATGLQEWTLEMQEQLTQLSRAARKAEARMQASRKGYKRFVKGEGRGTGRVPLSWKTPIKGKRFLRTLRQKLEADQILLPSERLWLATELRTKGTNLTPKEEELISNVELDGESSGKNEDDAEEVEKLEEDESERNEQNEKTEMERQEKRQEDERKSLWARLFSRSSSSSKSDDSRI